MKTAGRILTAGFILLVCLPAKAQHEPSILHRAMQDPACMAWVEDRLAAMTPEERVGQLFVYTLSPDDTAPNRALLRRVVQRWKVGGLLFSKGTPEAQAALTNRAQAMASVPLMITFDGEWGLAMRLNGTPAYPRNRVLGCITDEQLIYEYGREVARQCREMGVQVNFAPVADVNINPANPVIHNRSFGEDPRRVSAKVIRYASGLEDGGVLAVAKHFPGHGDTDTDSHLALPLLNFTRERLDSIELYPFRQAIRAGVGGIMVGHLEAPALEPRKGIPASLSHHVVQRLLREELGFGGLIFTDALAMKGVSGTRRPSLAALRAGNDMVLVSRDVEEEITAVIADIRRGGLSEEAVDRKCRRILAFKYALGLALRNEIRTAGLSARINTPYAHRLACRLREAAVTVVNNPLRILPLRPLPGGTALLTVGDAAAAAPFEQALGKHLAVTHLHLPANATPAERRRLRDTLPAYGAVVVCITDERPALSGDFLAELSAAAPIICLCFAPVKALTALEAGLSGAAAVLLAHSAEAYLQEHVAAVLTGRAAASGRLSTSIGRLFGPGDGVTILPAGMFDSTLPAGIHLH
jgi:beta-glucosidase-like glycosyl hydrolase